MYIVAAARGAPTDLELTRPPQPNERRQPGSVNAPQHLDKTRFVVVHTFNLPSRQRNGRSNKCRRRLLLTSAIISRSAIFGTLKMAKTAKSKVVNTN